MIGDSEEEIPELARVFCLDTNDSHHCCEGFDYKSATELLRRDPEQVRYVTYECERDIDPDSDSNKDRLFLQTGNPLLLHSPLRWACLETSREAEAMDFLETIRDIDPTQFLLQDSHGDLPIDGECVLNASLELLEFLLEIYLEFDFVCPNGVGMTEANFNPLTCLCGSYWYEDIRQATEELLSGKRLVQGPTVLHDNLGIEDQFWKKIILLTKAFYHKTIQEDHDDDENDEHDDSTDSSSTSTTNTKRSMLRITNDYADRRVEFRLLHACAGIDWFPPNLLRLLVTAFPEALTEADEDGNLPIHVAAGSCFESYKIDANWVGEMEANSGYQKITLDILLEANPDLAKLPNAEGRLPLELAIESSEHTLDATTKHNHKRWRPWEDGGIESLLRAFPEASKIRSPATGRLPLEIALGHGRDWEDGVQALLRAHPEAAALQNPRTGKYPLQLAIERETHFDDGVYGLLEVSPEAAWAGAVVLHQHSKDSRRRSRPTLSTNSNNRNSHTLRQHKACWMPLFAHAASENCSASVVYKLLRTNPGSCHRGSENTLTSTERTIPTTTSQHPTKRKRTLGQEQEIQQQQEPKPARRVVSPVDFYSPIIASKKNNSKRLKVVAPFHHHPATTLPRHF